MARLTAEDINRQSSTETSITGVAPMNSRRASHPQPAIENTRISMAYTMCFDDLLVWGIVVFTLVLSGDSLYDSFCLAVLKPDLSISAVLLGPSPLEVRSVEAGRASTPLAYCGMFPMSA